MKRKEYTLTSGNESLDEVYKRFYELLGPKNEEDLSLNKESMIVYMRSKVVVVLHKFVRDKESLDYMSNLTLYSKEEQEMNNLEKEILSNNFLIKDFSNSPYIKIFKEN